MTRETGSPAQADCQAPPSIPPVVCGLCTGPQDTAANRAETIPGVPRGLHRGQGWAMRPDFGRNRT